MSYVRANILNYVHFSGDSRNKPRMIVSMRERRYLGYPERVMLMRAVRIYSLVAMRAATQCSCDRDWIVTK